MGLVLATPCAPYASTWSQVHLLPLPRRRGAARSRVLHAPCPAACRLPHPAQFLQHFTEAMVHARLEGERKRIQRRLRRANAPPPVLAAVPGCEAPGCWHCQRDGLPAAQPGQQQRGDQGAQGSAVATAAGPAQPLLGGPGTQESGCGAGWQQQAAAAGMRPAGGATAEEEAGAGAAWTESDSDEATAPGGAACGRPFRAGGQPAAAVWAQQEIDWWHWEPRIKRRPGVDPGKPLAGLQIIFSGGEAG